MREVLEMLLYNKRDSEIDIYQMNPKEKKLRDYRKKSLEEQDTIFYDLKTNCEDTILSLFHKDELDIRVLECNSSSQWSFIEKNDMSKKPKKEIKPYDYEKRQIQKDMIKKYINGEYGTLEPTRVFEFIPEDDLDCAVYHLLRSENATMVPLSDFKEIWQVQNMMNLPKNLYLLQLLQLRDFEKLEFEDITKQLQLFDIDYSKSVKISDAFDMLETGLVSGTVDDVMKKVEASSKIFQKVRK